MKVNLDDHYARESGQKKRYHGANVVFTNEVVLDQNATDLAGGIPKYREIPSVSIQYPGMDKTCKRVEERDKIEYAAEWKAFQDNLTPPVDGTALSEWSLMPRPIFEEFRHMGFKTVEQLSEANEDVKRRLGPLQEWCKKAKNWLKPTEKNEVVTLKEQLEKLERRNEKLLNQVTLLMQRIEATEGTRLDESIRGNN